ncbi:MAG: antibiotic biosynthesis monooxygenase [Alphaproteobacteria bacterium]|nr:antibiotic biosynthesis monooxygenase [Alphaproteobacteria bacterium]
MIGVIARLKLKPGQGPAFETHMARMSRSVEDAEPGNHFYRGYRTADPEVFVALEAYKDRAALEAHGKSAHVAEALPRVGAMLDGDVEVEVLEQVW